VMVEIAEAGFRNMTALSNTEFSRPFDVERDGFVMGEGAGILILEEWEHATSRGATIYAEVLGAASTADAHHITAPDPSGHGAIRCMELALEDAGVTTSEVSHINAHGTSTPLNDLAESVAVRKVFGDRAPPVTSIKGHLGHSFAAAGALEGVASVMTLVNQVIPPTAGTTNRRPGGRPRRRDRTAPKGRHRSDPFELLRFRRPQRQRRFPTLPRLASIAPIAPRRSGGYVSGVRISESSDHAGDERKAPPGSGFSSAWARMTSASSNLDETPSLR
jgi:hypothetical protein